MHPDFAQLTTQWFKRAFVYTGSIGEFRYRFKREGDVLHAAVYSHYCYEVASDVAERDFSWDDAGVEQLRAWLQEQLTLRVSTETSL